MNAQETVPAPTSLSGAASEHSPMSPSRLASGHLQARTSPSSSIAPRSSPALRTSTRGERGEPGFAREFMGTIASGSGQAGRDPQVDGIEIPVQDIRQKRINACGDACMHVLLAHHGLPHANFGTNERPLLTGFTRPELVDAIRERGLQCLQLRPAEPRQVSEAELLDWLSRHGPLLASSPDHCFVVTGVRAGRVTIHCPLLGRRTGSIAALNKYLDWSNRSSPLSRTFPLRGDRHGAEETAAQDASPRLPGRAERGATRVLAKIEQASTRKWNTESS